MRRILRRNGSLPMTMETMKTHPAADLFPMMTDAELTELAADIKANGLLNPVVLLDGQILDGRNRLRACEIGRCKASVLRMAGCWHIARGLGREPERSQTASHRVTACCGSAVEAQGLMAQLAAEAKDRQRLGKARMPDPSAGGQSRDKVASLVGVSGRYISDVQKIKNAQPALLPRIKSGSLSVPAALRLIDEPQESLSTLLDGLYKRLAAFLVTDSASHPQQTLPRLVVLLQKQPKLSAEDKETLAAITNTLSQISVFTAEYHDKLRKKASKAA